jgi:ribosomal protein L28
MAYQCDICSKKTHAGRQHTHHTGVAGGQWKKRAQKTLRSFAPNLHVVSLPIKGIMTRVKACAKCIKRIKFDNKKASLAAV